MKCNAKGCNSRIQNRWIWSKFSTQKDEEKKGNEEATHEVPNQFVKEPCGRKTKFIDDDNNKYLNAEDYNELIRLENN